MRFQSMREMSILRVLREREIHRVPSRLPAMVLGVQMLVPAISQSAPDWICFWREMMSIWF